MTDSPVYQVALAQLFGTLLVSLLCLALGRVAVMSALLAGISCLVPTLYLLVISLKPSPAGDTGLGQVIKGEIGKFVLTMALLAGVFVTVDPLNVWVFFGTFALMQICYAIVPYRRARRMLRQN